MIPVAILRIAGQALGFVMIEGLASIATRNMCRIVRRIGDRAQGYMNPNPAPVYPSRRYARSTGSVDKYKKAYQKRNR